MIKERANFFKIIFLGLILQFFALPCSHAQNLRSVLPVEDPSSLFSGNIGDDDVEFFISGFWDLKASTSGSLIFNTSGTAFNPVPFLFTQTPDVYAMLQYKKNWFFEAYVTENVKDALFLFSYEGGENDFIKSIRFGNSTLNFKDYPYMPFGKVNGSFGLSFNAFDEKKGLTLDAMLRWDGLEWKSRTLFGQSETNETEVYPKNIIRGRHFILPNAPVSNVIITDTVDGVTRTLSIDEYSISYSNGVILLDEEPQGKLSATFSSLNGNENIVLYEKSVDSNGKITRTSSSYEAMNIYALSDSSQVRTMFVRNLASGITDSSFSVSRIASGIIEIIKNDAEILYTDIDYTKPFYDLVPWIYDETDDNETPTYPDEQGYVIIARTTDSVSSIVLEEGAIDGTISVYRDGVQTNAYTYDGETRIINFSVPPSYGENIVIRYAVKSSMRSSGALAFGLGTKIKKENANYQIAFGGRWPFFNSAYDEQGVIRSSWLGLSGLASYKDEKIDSSISAITKYQREGTSNYYKILSMDDYSASLVPMRIVSGNISGFDLSSVVDTSLSSTSAFSSIIENLHTSNSTNRIFEIKGNSSCDGSTTRLVKYVDEAPISSFKNMSFFVNTKEIPSGAIMKVSVGDGNSNGIEVSLPLDKLEENKWYKVSSLLSSVNPLVTITCEDGNELTILDAEGTYSNPNYAGLVELNITGLSQNSIVKIDEIIFENVDNGFSIKGDGKFVYGKENKGFYFDSKLTAAVADTSSIASSLNSMWQNDYFKLSLKANPVFDNNNFSFGSSYLVVLKDKENKNYISDSFSRNVESGTYSKNIKASVGLEKFNFLFENGSKEKSNVFNQNWKTSIQYGTIFSLKGNAELETSSSVLNTNDLLNSFLLSWKYFLPLDTISSTGRNINFQLNLFDSILTSNYTRTFDINSGVTNKLNAKVSYPFKIKTITFSPFYKRETEFTETSNSISFYDDFCDIKKDFDCTIPLWLNIPFVDLWEDFSSFSTLADLGTTVSHYAESGLELRRPIGYGLLDMFVPASFTFSYVHKINEESDTISQNGLYKVVTKNGAINILTQKDKKLKVDEYSSNLELNLEYQYSDGAILPTIKFNNIASFEYFSESSIYANISGQVKMTRSAVLWAETNSITYSTKPKQTVLGNIVDWSVEKYKSYNEKQRQLKESTNELLKNTSTQSESKQNWISSWFENIINNPFSYKNNYKFSLEFSKSENYYSALIMKSQLSYSTKVYAVKNISLGTGASLLYQASFYSNNVVNHKIGYELNIEMKLNF